MEKLSIILAIGLIVLIYALFYTISNDYGMFLLIILLLLAYAYAYVWVDERFEYAHQKVDNLEKGIEQKMESLKSNLFGALRIGQHN